MNAPWTAETDREAALRDKTEAIKAVELEIGANLKICRALSLKALATLDSYDINDDDTVSIDAAIHGMATDLDELGLLEVKS